MGNVIEFPGTKFSHITYMMGDDGPVGVMISKGNLSVEFWLDGDLTLENCMAMEMTSEEMSMLMIMWLSLVDPEVINYDAESLK